MYKLQIRWIKRTARNAMERCDNNLESALTDLRKRKEACEPEWHQPFAHMFASELYGHAANWLVNPELVEGLMIESDHIEDRMFNRYSDDIKGWKRMRLEFHRYAFTFHPKGWTFVYADRLTYSQAVNVYNRLEVHHHGLFGTIEL